MAHANIRSSLAAAVFFSLAAFTFHFSAKAADSSSVSVNSAAANLNAVKAYCSNIRDLAKDARHLRQLNELKNLSVQVDTKIRELRNRTQEYKKWYDLRRQFSDKATNALVSIYSKMRPDSAAAQFSAMNQMTAAALIIKLNSRTASAILNEIEPKKAAKLSAIISAAARQSPAGDPS